MSISESTQRETNAWGEELLKVRNHTIDSRRLIGLSRRPGDVFIATWGKSGTTWVQQIVAQLVLGGGSNNELNKVSPWLENRFYSFLQMRTNLENQQHKRFVKTHLPATALPYRQDARYIYIARDGRDAVWSWHNHHTSIRPEVFEMMRAVVGKGAPMFGPPTPDVRRFFLDWLDRDGYPLWPFWDHIKSWWSIRHLPNVLLLHFCDLKTDLLGSIQKIASFIEVDMDQASLQRVAECCSFAYMKGHSDKLFPEYAGALIGGASSFIHRGTGGGWKELLTPSDVYRYENTMISVLGADCARWLSQPYSIGSISDSAPNLTPAT
jgi:aryl sulfotransferase